MLGIYASAGGTKSSNTSAAEQAGIDENDLSPLDAKYIFPSPDPEDLPIWLHPNSSGPWQRIWTRDRKEIALLQTATARVISSCVDLVQQQTGVEATEIAMQSKPSNGHDFDRYGWRGDLLSITLRSFAGGGYPTTIVAGQGRQSGAVVTVTPQARACPAFIPLPGLRLPQSP